MLKGIPQILSPELLMVLCEMGHGDRIVISDGNFPAESMGKDAIVIRCDGHGVPELLDAILQLMPLDTYVEKPVTLMEVVPGRLPSRRERVTRRIITFPSESTSEERYWALHPEREKLLRLESEK